MGAASDEVAAEEVKPLGFNEAGGGWGWKIHTENHAATNREGGEDKMIVFFMIHRPKHNLNQRPTENRELVSRALGSAAARRNDDTRR